MPTAGLVNGYWDKIPAQIFDNGIMANIFVLFDHYYNKCVVKTAHKYCDDMISTEWGRLDRDSLCPYTGEDERGNFEHPDQQSLKEYFDEKASQRSSIIIWNLRYVCFSTWLLQLHIACLTDQRKFVIAQYSLISHCGNRHGPSIIIGGFKNRF